MTNNTKKILTTIVIILILQATVVLYFAIENKSTKITTFEECEKAGWLVRGIKVYDGSGPIQKECTLWSSKSFLKQSLFFPTQSKPATEHMEALLSGTLEEINDCLRVNGNLIIWPYGFSINTDEKGGIQVIDNRSYPHKSRPIIRVGDKVRFGGGGFSEDEYEDGMDMVDILSNLSAELPSDCCSGPYWILGEIISPPELTDDQRRAVKIATAHLSFPTTIVEVKESECDGCFSVKLQRNNNQRQFTIVIKNWKYEQSIY